MQSPSIHFSSDRTNVVQSAFAREILTSVLTHLGIVSLDAGSQEELEATFNERRFQTLAKRPYIRPDTCIRKSGLITETRM